MALSDPWAIEKQNKERIEIALIKKLGMSIDLYGSSNTDQVPLYCFKEVSNVDSEIIDENILDYSV